MFNKQVQVPEHGFLDVGGGSTRGRRQDNNLSNIPLRWMIKECFKANTGIGFDAKLLKEIGLECDDNSVANAIVIATERTQLSTAEGRDDADALSEMHDELTRNKFWWLLEGWPFNQRFRKNNADPDQEYYKKT